MMKKLLLIFLSCVAVACFGLAACNTSGGGSGGVEEESGLIFNEGYLDVIELGEPILLDEYINPNLTNDYTLVLSNEETGDVFDLKTLWQWTTTYPGDFTLTYTVNSGEFAGTVLTTTLHVVVPEITWVYSRGNFVYRVGTALSFSEFEKALNIAVKSYYECEFFVKSVQFEDSIQEIGEGATDYEFEKEGVYTFKFGMRSEDGQELTADQKINVRAAQIIEEGGQEYLDANNLTVNEHKLVTADGQITLDSGYYTNQMSDGSLPYVALNGNFGLDEYAIFEFTGRNLPQLAFFCKEVTDSVIDGKAGIYLHNGLTYNNGSMLSELDSSRLTIFGPNKVSYGEFDNRGRYEGATVGTVADPCPVSYLGLDPDCKYRYIVGFTNPVLSTNIADVLFGRYTSVTLRIILVNLTTGEREFNYSRNLDLITAGPIDVIYENDYFSGNIVAYGRFGKEIKIDKIYTPVKTDNIENLDIACEFKSTRKSKVALDATARVADYIDIPEDDYVFEVYDPDGEQVTISEAGVFKFEKSGTYRIFYDQLKEGIRRSSVTVEVMFDPNVDMGDDFYESYGSIRATAMRNGTAMITNTNENFITEGKKSIKYYTNVTTSNGCGIVVGIEKSFSDFIFLSRAVDGLSFQVYSEQELKYKLYPAWGDFTGRPIVEDFTGTIPAETWTTLYLTRELFTKNASSYDSCNDYAMALSFYVEGEELPAQSHFYIDDVQLIAGDYTQTMTEIGKAFLEANNMEIYGYKSVNDDLSVELYDGIVRGHYYGGNMKDDDLPYVAYKGAYGAGDYVVVDFTGTNVPQLCFFAKDITASLLDGLQGVYVSSGVIKEGGDYYSPTDSGRVTFFGPNKVEYCEIDNRGRYSGQFGGKDNPSPLAIRGLVEGTRYRYVAGIKSASVGSVTLEFVLINLDTNAKLLSNTKTISDAAFTEEYISGSIILYGRYNAAIKLDKIYPLYQGVTDVLAIDKVVEGLGQ